MMLVMVIDDRACNLQGRTWRSKGCKYPLTTGQGCEVFGFNANERESKRMSTNGQSISDTAVFVVIRGLFVFHSRENSWPLRRFMRKAW